MRKVVLTFGLIAGAMLSAMMLLTIPFMDRIGHDNGMVVGYTTMVLAFLMVYFGVKSYRDNVGGGSVTFGRAFRVGVLITLIATVCYVATWMFMYYNIVPDFADNYAAHAIDKAREGGASAAELAAKTEEMAEFKEMYKDPLVVIAFTFLEPLPVGLLATLLTSWVVSRRRGSAASETG